jgi:hypothetical protein
MKLPCILVGANHPDLAARSRNMSFPPAASIHDSPPCVARDSAMASIHGQLLGLLYSHFTPSPPVCNSGCFPLSVSIAASLVEPSQGSRGGNSNENSDNNYDNDNDDDASSRCRGDVDVHGS